MTSKFAALVGLISLLACLVGACSEHQRDPRNVAKRPLTIEPADDAARVRRFTDPETGAVCYLFWSDAISCVLPGSVEKK